MDPIGAFLTGIVTSAEAKVVLPAISLALVIAGVYWAFTHSEHGKTKAIAALMGGALAIMAPTLATGLKALSGGVAPVATPSPVPAGLILLWPF